MNLKAIDAILIFIPVALFCFIPAILNFSRLRNALQLKNNSALIYQYRKVRVLDILMVALSIIFLFFLFSKGNLHTNLFFAITFLLTFTTRHVVNILLGIIYGVYYDGIVLLRGSFRWDEICCVDAQKPNIVIQHIRWGTVK